MITREKSEAETKIENTASDLGLTVRAEFIPFRESRNFKPNATINDLSLNWRVTIECKGRHVLTTDYMAGVAHCPSYTQNMTENQARYVRQECDNGKTPTRAGGIIEGKPIKPNTADVIYSLVSDASAIDCATFEDWCADNGCDSDSIRDRATYRTCLMYGLALRHALGNDGLTRLREACEGY